MLILFFLISFAYNILRGVKDTLIVTAEGSGAEAIPFIKMYAMFPAAIFLTALFTRLSTHFSRENVFYIMISVFMIFFLFFGTVLYPNRELLHLHSFAAFCTANLPEGFMGFIAMIRYWIFTSFYVMAELWGALLLSLLFWGFANDITKICEAKRFYGLFAIGANVASIVSGQVSIFLSRRSFNPRLHFGSESWEQSLMLLIFVVVIICLLLMVVFRWMHCHVLTDPKLCNVKAVTETASKKTKMSLRKNIAYILSSKYLLGVAVIVVTYNVVINLVEVVWKHQIKLLYPLPADYNVYMNQITTMTGIVATLIALLISGNAIRKCGWTFTALITPIILLVTSVVFFGTLLFSGHFSDVLISFTGMTPLYLVAFVGSAQNILSRASKYTVFDATKEITYIPLDRDARIKSKSAIDGVGSRMGKSGGAIIHQVLLMIFGSLAVTAPYVAVILIVIIVGWIIATKRIGKKVDKVVNDHEFAIFNKNGVISGERVDISAPKNSG